MSATGLHELALKAFRIGNRGRLTLCETLRVLNDTRLYVELGYPSITAYAGRYFHVGRTETYECVRVARALADLTDLRDEFARGRMGWSVLKAVSRVASVDSQSKWIEHVREFGAERTIFAAQDALRRRSDTPRGSSCGLPNLDQRLLLRFSRSDMVKVMGWLERGADRIKERTGAADLSLEQILLFLCEEAGSAGADSSSSGTSGPAAHAEERSRAQIVYHRCPDCRRARMGTRDGFVEVSTEEVERYEVDAEAVVIDGPTPPWMRRAVRAREGGQCGNPRCHHRSDHCHHIRFRSRGGPTELANEVAVCATCHALIHAGLLRVRGRADGELRWEPIADARTTGESIDSQSAAADALPVLRVEGVGESADADSRSGTNGCTLDAEALAAGLRRLGIPAARARQLIDEAIAGLAPSERTESGVLRRALAGFTRRASPSAAESAAA